MGFYHNYKENGAPFSFLFHTETFVVVQFEQRGWILSFMNKLLPQDGIEGKGRSLLKAMEAV